MDKPFFVLIGINIKNSIKMKKTNLSNRYGIIILLMVFMAVFAPSCSDDPDITVPDSITETLSNNPAKFIKDKDKLATIYTLKKLDEDGGFYEVNYTADYKLDEAVNANISSTMELLGFVQQRLFDSIPNTVNNSKMSILPGCSAFAVPDLSTGSYMMGRNYDFLHKVKIGSDENGKDLYSYIPIAAFLVRTAPKGGKKSISFVDGLNFGYTKGFYSDDSTDLSLLVGLPYAALDGINEDGFAIGVLSLNEAPTKQNDPAKSNILTTLAIRMLLDKASTVKQAIEMLKQYNMRMYNTDDLHNYHFFMADATGDYAIVEYTRDTKNPAEKYPTRMEVFSNNDTLRCVTNFYVSPTMTGTKDGWGSTHGLARYQDMRAILSSHDYTLDADGCVSLLSLVSQKRNDDDPTSFTQWSALYNLSEKSVRLALLREYGIIYKFKIE